MVYSISSLFTGLFRMPNSKPGDFYSNLIVELPKIVTFFLFLNWKINRIPFHLIALQIINYLLFLFSLIKRYKYNITDIKYFQSIGKVYMVIIAIFAFVTVVDYIVYSRKNQ